MSRDRVPPKPGARSDHSAVPEALLDCHQKLRAVTALGAALAESQDVPAEDVLEVAAKLHRYFTLSLPLHEQDEERSLFPRLVEHAPELAPTLALLRADHHRQAQEVAKLVALCEQLQGEPVLAGQHARALAEATAAVAQNWQDHMAIEERELFSAARHLPATVHAAISEEMRERRAHLPR